MNRIKNTLAQNTKLLSIYFTAGYPEPEDTVSIIKDLEKNGIDFIEIGLPFSDPLADGPTIQESSGVALKNGMTTKKLFQQLEGIREEVEIPLIIMGYFNPILQFGVEAFCQSCAAVGIDGLIIPDLPVEEYNEKYREIFEKYGLSNIFLITPQTSEERIRFIDSVSEGFIYMVSTASVTGSTKGFTKETRDYFRRISEMKLRNPQIVGFGISDKETYGQATEFAKGAIIGSAFIKHLNSSRKQDIADFVKSIRPV
ncbi:tryptophan synthase subunit alpha [Salegentibacter flavus]|uniref:Tryptophan synthase alpha chain n=1 Tax=Salegentibacter flavus TaxID=287099 RepID=A0A1I5C1Y4_9FLAO|nr:tryptophan synthase subunit alpha [Salegentibacter flavus]SFN80641.1 tryptophan synthase, alpha chain [Salegentibacter flavus]